MPTIAKSTKSFEITLKNNVSVIEMPALYRSLLPIKGEDWGKASMFKHTGHTLVSLTVAHMTRDKSVDAPSNTADESICRTWGSREFSDPIVYKRTEIPELTLSGKCLEGIRKGMIKVYPEVMTPKKTIHIKGMTTAYNGYIMTWVRTAILVDPETNNGRHTDNKLILTAVDGFDTRDFFHKSETKGKKTVKRIMTMKGILDTVGPIVDKHVCILDAPAPTSPLLRCTNSNARSKAPKQKY